MLRTSLTLLPLFFITTLIGCGPDQLNNADQDDNNTVKTCTPPLVRDPVTNTCIEDKKPNNNPNNANNVFDDCPVAARPIYVVDATQVNEQPDYKLLRFEPTQRKFTEIGRLQCPARAGATPFSMSVDRRARAWVLYSSGEIFLVDTSNASCQSSGFQPSQQGFDVFGMGFVLSEPGSTKDVLYIAGGKAENISKGTAGLASIGELSKKVTPLANLNGWPELTGTARGELWGFFPGTSPPKVAQISRTNGTEGKTFPITSITGQPNAWAFAFWGGDFYLFYKSQMDQSSRVFHLKSSTGAVEEIIPNSGHYIVGAGVSTCAPVIEL